MTEGVLPAATLSTTAMAAAREAARRVLNLPPVRTLAARPWLVVTLAAVGAVALGPAWTARDAAGYLRDGDGSYFAAAGTALLHGHSPYGAAALQAGPLQLVWLAALRIASTPFGSYATLAQQGVTALCAAGALLVLARSVLAEAPYGQELAALVVLVTGAGGTLGWVWATGHPAQLAIPLLWVLAARARDRWWLLGALVGLSAWWETWGLLGVGLALLVAGRAGQVRAAAAAAVSAVAGYLPFVLAGPFAMFDYRWPVFPATLVHLAVPYLPAFPWPLRLLQAVAAVGAGAAVVVRRSTRAEAVWLAPAVVVAVRVLLDPLGSGYYWLPLQVLVPAGALAVLGRRRPALPSGLPSALASVVPAAALAAAVLAGWADAAWPGPFAVLPLTAVLAVLALALSPAGRSAGPVGMGPTGGQVRHSG